MTGGIVLAVVLVPLLTVALLHTRRVSSGRAKSRAHAAAVRRELLAHPLMPVAGLVHADAPVVGQALRAVEREVLDDVVSRGRHRRPDGELPDGKVSATSIFRAIKAEEQALPPLPRPTGDQLRGAGR